MECDLAHALVWQRLPSGTVTYTQHRPSSGPSWSWATHSFGIRYPTGGGTGDRNCQLLERGGVPNATCTGPDEHVITVRSPLILPSFGEDPFGHVVSGQFTLCSNTQSIRVEGSTGRYLLRPQNRLSTAKSVWDPSDDQSGYYFASGDRSLSFKGLKIRPDYLGTVLAESDELLLFLLFTSSHDCLWWNSVNGYALVLRALNDAPAFFERFGTVILQSKSSDFALNNKWMLEGERRTIYLL
jgi:hypothetical protein